MQSIKLNMQDNLVEKVYDFLKTLPKNEIEIIETTYDKKIPIRVLNLQLFQ